MPEKRILRAAALALAATFALAGCATDGAGGTSGLTGDGSSTGGGDKGTITLGYLPSWTDGLSTAYLLQDQLEKLGYDVEMKTLTEAGPLYAGLAQGDVDLYPSAWPELTHAEYMKKYSDDIEDLGAYYDHAKLTIAVPEYSDIDSIDDLAGRGGEFGGKIVGIEPGAGLTAQAGRMLSAYGLDGEYSLLTSSTAAMLTELKAATEKQEDIVVTLWRPFWANDAFPVKDLEDPKGAMGEAEGLHFLGTSGFSDEFPEAADLIEKISLDDEQYGALEDLVVNQYGEGQEADAVDAWLEEYVDQFDWTLSD